MPFRFKAKLMTIMGIFSILLTLSVSLVDQHRLKDNLITGYKRESALVEDTVVSAVSAADKAFQIFDQDIEKKMKIHSDALLQKYQGNPDLASWDYQELKKEIEGMDIYIIDTTHTILYSSFVMDIGLSFKDEGSFSKLL